MPFCSKCGANVADGVAFCGACGQPMAGYSIGQGVAARAPAASAAPMAGYGAPAQPVWQGSAVRTVSYAGFWLRFVALIIDTIVLSIVRAIITVPFGLGFGMRNRGMFMGHPPQNPEDLVPIFGMMVKLMVITMILNWLYYSIFESSSWQATLGKKALGLEVTDLSGNRISFGRATGRFFGKIISTLILFIGYIMAGFTEKKQALHDILAGTLVIRKM